MEKEFNKHKILIFVVILLIFILSRPVLSIGTNLLCLENHQIVEFSKCNPKMNDYECLKDQCQICVKETSQGIYCPARISSCKSPECVYLKSQEIKKQDTEININLLFPLNNAEFNESDEINFSFKSSEAYQFEYCDLIINNNAVKRIERPIKPNGVIINYSLESGDYVWSVNCTTRKQYNSLNISSKTRNLFILTENDSIIDTEENMTENSSSENQTFFEIILLSPDDGFSSSGTKTINFSYNLSEEINESFINNCSLILNDNFVETKFLCLDSNNSLENSTELNQTNFSNCSSNNFKYFIKVVNPGAYSWKILCFYNNQTIESATQNFILTNPPVHNTGGGGGGSGGSGGSSIIIKKKNKTSENLTSNNLKNKTKINSSGSSKSIEPASSHFIGPKFINSSEQVSKNGLNDITGNVISLIEPVASSTTGLTIAVLVFLGSFYLLAKRHIKK